MFFEMSYNSQETLVSKETPMNFAKFLRTTFLQNNSGQLLLKCGHCSNKVRDINCDCCRELDAMLIALAKIPESKGSISPFRLLRTSAQQLVKWISLIYLIDAFFYWFLVKWTKQDGLVNKRFYLFVLVLIRWNKKESWVNPGVWELPLRPNTSKGA